MGQPDPQNRKVRMAKTDSAEHLEAAKARFRDHSHLNVDVRLSHILDLTFESSDSHKEGSISMTVVADGAVISGLVISEDAWAERQADAIQQNSDNFAEALRLVQGGFLKLREARNKERAENPDEPTAFRTKLHFGRATIISGSTNVNVENLRVDLKHVTAWALGEMDARG